MPTLIASDNFDSYTNTSALGAPNWEVVNNIVVVYNPDPFNQGSVYGSSQAMARRTETFSPNHRVECTCRALSPGSYNFCIIGVRCQSGADTRYGFQTDGTNWFLFARVAGVHTNLIISTHSITAGAKIALEVSGAGSATRLTVQTNSGGGWTNVTGAVSIDPGSGNYIDGGKPGIGADASTAALGDDFLGYNLDAVGGVVIPAILSRVSSLGTGVR